MMQPYVHCQLPPKKFIISRLSCWQKQFIYLKSGWFPGTGTGLSPHAEAGSCGTFPSTATRSSSPRLLPFFPQEPPSSPHFCGPSSTLVRRNHTALPPPSAILCHEEVLR